MKTFALLLTLALLAAPSMGATNSTVQRWTETQPGLALGIVAPVSFAGTWKTFVRCKPVDVTLTQVGDKVTGTYSPGNGRIFDGVVTDNTLSFKWTQDGGTEGIGEFIMDVGGKGFAGTSSQLKPRGYVIAWNTTNPSVTPFAGIWQTSLDGRNEVSLTMQQSGVQVTGQYPGNGKIEGTVSGRVLRFKWQSDRGTGSGRFVMEVKNYTFIGTYNRGANPDDVDSTWSGRRPPGPESVAGCEQPLGEVQGDPRPIRPEGTGGRNVSEAELAKKQAEYEERQKNAPVAFDGVWRVKSGEQFVFPELLLQPVGSDRVVGRLFANRPEMGVIKEGTVIRNTLRFTVWRPGRVLFNGRLSPDEYMGTGELVMNADGKSFRGTILGAGINGTLIAR
jgi:hypothetical protein